MFLVTLPLKFVVKHFSDKLFLKRVERLPSLVQDLAKNVDTALNAALKTLPPLYGFITAEQRDNIASLDEVVIDGKAIANFYHQILLARGFDARPAPHRFIFAMAQSLVLVAITTFLWLRNCGRVALLHWRKQ